MHSKLQTPSLPHISAQRGRQHELRREPLLTTVHMQHAARCESLVIFLLRVMMRLCIVVSVFLAVELAEA